jgi:hypothetical protein
MSTEESTPRRQSAWNTYTPFSLALFSVLGAVLVVAIIISLMPAPVAAGVAPEAQSLPIFQIILGVLCIVFVARQLQLRSRR